MGERYNIHSQLEHLQSKYIGTGHADTTKWEWLTNQHRDRYYRQYSPLARNAESLPHGVGMC